MLHRETLSKKLWQNSDAILLSIILNINVIKFFLNIQDSSVFLNFFYLICIFILYYKYHENLYKIYTTSKTIKSYGIFWICILSFSLITAVIITSEYKIFFKFLISIFIALTCICLPSIIIKQLFKYTIIINIIYGILLLINPQKTDIYLGNGAINYLNMTLTLGLCLSLSLCEIINSFYKSLKKNIFKSFVLTIFFLFSVMQFPARGVMLFPPVIAIYIGLLDAKKHKSKFIAFIIVLSILLIGVVIYFLQNASEYALVHMTHLFENTEGESRVEVWTTSYHAIIDNFWLFFGAGLNGFDKNIGFYPHNIFFQFIADFGILSCLIFLCFVIYALSHYKRVIHTSRNQTLTHSYYYCYVSLIYYLLTFSKSFSMYDSCPLLIMLSLCLSFPIRIKTSTISENVK